MRIRHLTTTALLGFLTTVNNVLSVQIVRTAIYPEGAECSNEPLFHMVKGPNQECIDGWFNSIKYGCSDTETFTDKICKETGLKAPVITDCASTGGNVDQKYECVDVPDGQVAKILMGYYCGGFDAGFNHLLSKDYIMLDTCTSFNLNDPYSFKFSASAGKIQIMFYNEAKDCTGPFQTETQPIGECTFSLAMYEYFEGRPYVEGDTIQGAINIVPAIKGAILGSNVGMSTSTNVLVLMVAIVATMAIILS